MKGFLAKHSPLVILAVLCVVLALVSGNFGTAKNLKKNAYRTSDVAIVATGEVLVILSAGIDLSVGSVAALSGCVAAKLMDDFDQESGLPILGNPAVAVVLGLLCAACVGAINGMLVTKGRIPAFIATLGMMMVVRGVVSIMTQGQAIGGLPESYAYLGGTASQSNWIVPVLLALVVVAVFAVALTVTRFGRALYATGGNLQGARLSGINTDRIRFLAFTLCGLMAGLAGVVQGARMTLGDPTSGEGMELDAIAACVIGGASLMGGEGGAIGALAGALIMSVLVNFCNLQGIDPYWQKVLVGSLIIVLVFYDSWRKRAAGLLRD
jgi:ribose transport system permease protein